MERLSAHVLGFAIVAMAMAFGCRAHTSYIPGTKVVDTQFNRDIIEAVEKYRLAVEKRDAAALFGMASRQYFEDGGTTDGKDDYGYSKLREVLIGRFQQGTEIRYSVRYMNIHKRCPRIAADDQSNDGCRAYVDVLIDASYTIRDAQNRPSRRDKRDQNQLVLQWENDRWTILSGM